MSLVCNTCKKQAPAVQFDYKLNGEVYKLCNRCREQGRIWNNRRAAEKNRQAKIHYAENKKLISQKNKAWRESNKDKLRAYERNEFRKEKNRKWRATKKEQDPYRFIWYAARRRSKLNSIPFELTKQDVKDLYPVDGRCPVFGIELVTNSKVTKDNSPSLDRIIPEKGYVKGNVIIISHKANRIKNNATVEELKKLVCFLDKEANK